MLLLQSPPPLPTHVHRYVYTRRGVCSFLIAWTVWQTILVLRLHYIIGAHITVSAVGGWVGYSGWGCSREVVVAKRGWTCNARWQHMYTHENTLGTALVPRLCTVHRVWEGGGGGKAAGLLGMAAFT